MLIRENKTVAEGHSSNAHGNKDARVATPTVKRSRPEDIFVEHDGAAKKAKSESAIGSPAVPKVEQALLSPSARSTPEQRLEAHIAKI